MTSSTQAPLPANYALCVHGIAYAIGDSPAQWGCQACDAHDGERCERCGTMRVHHLGDAEYAIDLENDAEYERTHGVERPRDTCYDFREYSGNAGHLSGAQLAMIHRALQVYETRLLCENDLATAREAYQLKTTIARLDCGATRGKPEVAA